VTVTIDCAGQPVSEAPAPAAGVVTGFVAAGTELELEFDEPSPEGVGAALGLDVVGLEFPAVGSEVGVDAPDG